MLNFIIARIEQAIDFIGLLVLPFWEDKREEIWMVQLSISFKTSTKMTSIKHNNRDLTEEEFKQPQHQHIDQDKIHENIYIKQEPIKEAYEKIFGSALEEYNSKQTRKDRRIEDYFQHVKKSKTLDLQREFIVGIGDKYDWDRIKNSAEAKRWVGEKLAEYVEEFQERHPHLYIYNAAVHLDEKGHPHAHFNIIPVAEGYKKGLSIQPSFKKALQNEGNFEKGRHQLRVFKEQEVKILSEKMKSLGIERKLVGTNDIKDMREYKRLVRELEKEKEAISEEVHKHREQALDELLEVEDEIKANRETLSRLKDSIQEKREESAQLSLEGEKTLSELSNLQDRVKGLESEKRGLESKIEAKSGELVRLDEKIEQQKSFLNDLSREYALNPLPSEKERSYFFEVLEKAKKTITGKITFDFDFVSQLKNYIHSVNEKIQGLISQNILLRRQLEMKDTELGKVKFDLKLAEAKNKGFDDKFKTYKEKADVLDKLSDVLSEKEIELLNDRIIALESSKTFSVDRDFQGPEL